MVDIDSLNILIVDDEHDILDVLSRVIKAELYNKVITATNSEVALKYIERGNVSVVVLDINLGLESGIDILKRIKEINPCIQVVVITGVTTVDSIEASYKNGADDFIRKPFSNSNFLAIILRRLNKYKLLYENEQYKINLEQLVEDKTLQLTASNQRLTTLLYNTVETVSRLIECKDPYTAGHQNRVTRLAVAIAKERNLCSDSIKTVYLSGLLHDVGKIAIPQELLVKPSKLTKNEFNLIKDHSIEGYKIVSNIPFELPIAKIVLQHHEKLNGSGYPSGIHNVDILTEAKVLSVADIFEAMASHRPYRRAINTEDVLKHFYKQIGILYCEESVEACLYILEKFDYDINAFISHNIKTVNINNVLSEEI